MKKTYIKPEIEIVELEVVMLQATSGGISDDTMWNPGDSSVDIEIGEEDPDNPLIDGDLG